MYKYYKWDNLSGFKSYTNNNSNLQLNTLTLLLIIIIFIKYRHDVWAFDVHRLSLSSNVFR